MSSPGSHADTQRHGLDAPEPPAARVEAPDAVQGGRGRFNRTRTAMSQLSSRVTEPRGAPLDGPTTLYRLFAPVAKRVVRLLFRPDVRGLEHLPGTGGLVLSANQLSNLDGFLLAYAVYPRQVRWMAKAELFVPPLARLMPGLGIFPVRRGEGDVDAVGTAVALARAGHAVGIFPEGTRRAKGVRKRHAPRPHTGAARVALAAGVPLVPAAIRGTEALTRLRRWRVAFGPPIVLSDVVAELPRPAAREATRRLWEAIGSLEAELAPARPARPPLRLYPRLRLDISLGDLVFALAACVFAWKTRPRAERVLREAGATQDGLVCLSVRSAFDLLLRVLALPAGSEVLVSAVTHPDMVRILEAHRLRVVPVDLDDQTLAPRLDRLERAITPATRALLIAHLFGGRVDLEPLSDLARRHGLVLIEDCAQSLRARDDGGDRRADASLFSFGSIKTATALGGAIARIRIPGALGRMRELQDAWPVQRRRDYAVRLVKFVALRALSEPRAYGVFARACVACGRDLDSVVTGAVRAFGPSAQEDLLRRIRRRPSAPLLALLLRRLRRFDGERLRRRAAAGERILSELEPAFAVPGRAALDRTHWVFPVVVSGPDRVIAMLRGAGFDASRATSSIEAVAPPLGRPELGPATASRLMESVVFVPVYPELPERELDRLVDVLSSATRNGRGNA